MPSSDRRYRQDETVETVLSCLVGGVNRIGDKSRLFLVVIAAFRDWTKVLKLSVTNIMTCRQLCSHY